MPSRIDLQSHGANAAGAAAAVAVCSCGSTLDSAGAPPPSSCVSVGAELVVTPAMLFPSSIEAELSNPPSASEAEPDAGVQAEEEELAGHVAVGPAEPQPDVPAVQRDDRRQHRVVAAADPRRRVLHGAGVRGRRRAKRCATAARRVSTGAGGQQRPAARGAEEEGAAVVAEARCCAPFGPAFTE